MAEPRAASERLDAARARIGGYLDAARARIGGYLDAARARIGGYLDAARARIGGYGCRRPDMAKGKPPCCARSRRCTPNWARS
jgi:hypothetical protein